MAWLRFLWRIARGYRLRPWRSPLLAWRIETFTGLPAERVGLGTFWVFCWRERAGLLRFLAWTQQMSDLRRHDRHPSQSSSAGP